MKKSTTARLAQRFGIIALVAIIGFSFAACGDGNDNGGGSGGTAVTFSSANANGSASQTSTQLTLVFSQAITGLSADDITLSGMSGVSKGTLTNTGATYTLPISGFTSGGTLNIAVSKTGYSISGSPKTATVYYYDPKPEIEGMVWIQPGTFQMGSPESEPGRGTNETQHSVTLTKGFYMGKYPVTQGQYEAVMGNNPSMFKVDGYGTGLTPSALGSITDTANFPVEQVTWYDAVEFCNKLSVLEGLTPVYTITGRSPATGYPITAATVTPNWSANGYRLPTEAQWEYACRAGTTTAYNTGATIGNNTGWYTNYSVNRTHSVGEKPMKWGLYDMHGNVWEWCWDRYGTYASGAQTDPTGAVSEYSGGVIRGGSWYEHYEALRSACRVGISHATQAGGDIGFRLVRP
jgi:formylglycine-generating enzyme required for sulfatase activity